MTSAEWIASKKFSKLFNGSSQQQLFYAVFFLDFKLLYPKANDFDKSFKEKNLNKIFLLANQKSVDIPDVDPCLLMVNKFLYSFVNCSLV
jgi:hypothetical protein